ncbi:hypothetical protein M422DRAFT_272961 [Sphaerobolus stellatus SS14]|uniref:Unplaced genomic scaffold SPHSTscaffold_313, whole genome shotgun sequence n=1 Tax=Sphaerobolus stellatus (strain SS14) TaxID=990650 RepID=A0A0C9UAA7_SPHS4|nr:hypothetical protein M422DRAFT_272961 [Sphaerobolus stellatus SS14]
MLAAASGLGKDIDSRTSNLGYVCISKGTDSGYWKARDKTVYPKQAHLGALRSDHRVRLLLCFRNLAHSPKADEAITAAPTPLNIHIPHDATACPSLKGLWIFIGVDEPSA